MTQSAKELLISLGNISNEVANRQDTIEMMAILRVSRYINEMVCKSTLTTTEVAFYMEHIQKWCAYFPEGDTLVMKADWHQMQVDIKATAV